MFLTARPPNLFEPTSSKLIRDQTKALTLLENRDMTTQTPSVPYWLSIRH